MNLNGIIESAELQFKQILEEFFIAVYDEKSLSSHGIDHHRRNTRMILSFYGFSMGWHLNSQRPNRYAV
jgi:hypothetical protein